MPTEGQRNRRRRQRQRQPQRRTRNLTNRRRRSNPAPALAFIGRSVTNANAWLTSTYEFNIAAVTADSPNHIYEFKFKDLKDWKDHLSKSGEYRLIRAVVAYSPLTSHEGDKIALAPYFDTANRLIEPIDFITSGRPLRKADNPHTEVLAIQSEISTTDILEPIGGITIYFSGKQVDFGVLTIIVTYQIRGRKTINTTVKAEPLK